MTSSPAIRPIRDQVLVRQDPRNEKTDSGLLYMPDSAREQWRDIATVQAVGPKVVDVKEGDRVLFKRRANSALLGDGLEGGNEEWKGLLMLREEDIYAVIEGE